MSTAAIAGVSSTLRNLLRDRMDDPPGVTIAPPDVTVDGTSGRRLNLYLYHLAENGFLKNQELPGGVPPPLSLTLHYLVTAFGGDTPTSPDADLQAQRVLGDAMRVLHDFPILTPALHEQDDVTRPPILDPSLLDAVERVRVAFESAPPDELAKLWSALPQANYRCSAVYEVTVVQIDSRHLARGGPPVTTRKVHVASLRRPIVAKVYRTVVAGEVPGDPRAAIGQGITIEGSGFRAPKTWVKVGALEPIVVTPASDERIEFLIPGNQYPPDADHPMARPIPEPDRLRPGPQIVKVLVQRPTDVTEGGLGAGVSSDAVNLQGSSDTVFLLVPSISGTSPASGAGGTILSVNGERLFRRGSVTVVLVGDRSFVPLDPDDPASPPGTVRTATTVQARTEGLTPDATPYRVRIRVDGAEALEDTHTFQVTP